MIGSRLNNETACPSQFQTVKHFYNFCPFCLTLTPLPLAPKQFRCLDLSCIAPPSEISAPSIITSPLPYVRTVTSPRVFEHCWPVIAAFKGGRPPLGPIGQIPGSGVWAKRGEGSRGLFTGVKGWSVRRDALKLLEEVLQLLASSRAQRAVGVSCDAEQECLCRNAAKAILILQSAAG
jgi:hypothetical protein